MSRELPVSPPGVPIPPYPDLQALIPDPAPPAPFPLLYPPSPHEVMIRDHFAGGPLLGDPDPEAPSLNQCLFILFSNRSGSNWLASCLALAGGLGAFGEYFNGETLIEHACHGRLPHVTAYIEFLQATAMQRPEVLCSKLGWGQLYFLQSCGWLGPHLPQSRFIWIRRDDLLAQAISYAIALQTGAWTSLHPRSTRKPVYDEAQILDILQGLQEADRRFADFFILQGIQPIQVTYEALMADPQGTVEQILGQLGYSAEAFDLGQIAIKQQSTALNRQFHARFLQSMAKGLADKARLDDQGRLRQRRTVDILVPLYNGLEALRRCLDSLLRHTDAAHPIWLIDDASSDLQVQSWLASMAQAHERVRVLSYEDNLGFAGNVNRGLRATAGDVVVLNSDAQVTAGWLERLLAPLDADPEVGIVCPVSNHATLLSVPLMNRENHLPEGISVEVFAEVVAQSSGRDYPEIPVAAGFCMLIRRALIDRIGLLDEAFRFGYGEECDYSLRAWREGFKVICADDALVFHQGEVSFSTLPSRQLQQIRDRNAALLVARWPFYNEAVSAFCRRNPLRKLQERVYDACYWGAKRRLPHVLELIHGIGRLGGTELHTMDMAERLVNDYRISVLYPSADAEFWSDLEVAPGQPRQLLANTRETRHDIRLLGYSTGLTQERIEGTFLRVLQGGDFALLHVQHLAGWGTLRLPLLASQQGIPVIISLHDYFLLCPIYDLLKPDGYSCGKTGVDAEDPDCLACLNQQGDQPFQDRALKRYLERRQSLVRELLDAAVLLIAPSHFVQRKFMAACGRSVADKILVVPHGVTTLPVLPLPPAPRLRRIAILTNLQQRKGAAIVFALLERQWPVDLEFHHFGGIAPHDRPRVEQMAQLRCHGPYRREQLVECLADMDLVLTPSVYEETFCLTVAEAQALGLPVVAFAVGAMAERIEHGMTGWLVESVTAEALAEQIAALLKHPLSVQQVREHLRSLQFKDLRANAVDYARLYRQVIQARSAPVTRVISGPGAQPSPPVDAARGLPELTVTPETATHCGSLQYRRWLARTRARWHRPPGYDTGPSLLVLIDARTGPAQLLRMTLDALIRTTGARWRALIVAERNPLAAGHDAWPLEWISAQGKQMQRLLNRCVWQADEDWVTLLQAGAILDSDWPLILSRYLAGYPEARWFYADEDRMTARGERYAPAFKPDFNLYLARSTPYWGRGFLTRRDALIELGGFASVSGAASYALGLRVAERWGRAAVAHIPWMLFHEVDLQPGNARDEESGWEQARMLQAHLQRQAVPGGWIATSYPGLWWVDYVLDAYPTVTLLIPTQDPDACCLPRLQAQLAQLKVRRYEMLVVDASSGTLSHHREALGHVTYRVYCPQTSSLAAMIDCGIGFARGQYLWLLHDQIASVEVDALRQLLALVSQPDVGVVSPCLLDPQYRIQYGPGILGLGALGILGFPWAGASLNSPVDPYRMLAAQETRALAPWGLLMAKSLYESLGGFAVQSLPNVFFALDLCLKASAAGWKIIWTPHARVTQNGEGSVQAMITTRLTDQDLGTEAAWMLANWLDDLAHDPNYHPCLSLREPVWQPDDQRALGWDPLRLDTDPPRICAFPDNLWGSGHYRIIDPLSRLEDLGCADVAWMPVAETERPPHPVEMRRLHPDIIVAHHFLHDSQRFAWQLYRHHQSSRLILSLDDLITELPDDNPFAQTNYRDMSDRLRQMAGLADRLIVSTQPLAEAYAGWAPSVRVVPNALDERRWSHLENQPRGGNKLRILWAGAMQHHGDLIWLLPLLEAMRDAVDWVFFGMCPPELRPCVAEFHPMTPFAEYPARLAELGADLAIAPLASNAFNHCKSNLKLLEYGMIGLPVIASDITPYQGAPVLRLPNRWPLWAQAIRERMEETDELRRHGRVLRAWVQNTGLLTQRAELWREALCD